jgi:transcriptional regulator with XRE-family HTH domain
LQNLPCRCTLKPGGKIVEITPASPAMPYANDSYGAALRAARITLGMTVAEVGERCGYSASTVSRWENGKRNWSMTDLTRVAEVLGVPRSVFGLPEKRADSPQNQREQTRVWVEDEHVERRQMLKGSLAALSAVAIGGATKPHGGLERALYTTTDVEPATVQHLTNRVAAAENDLREARLTALDCQLPALLTTTHATFASNADAPVVEASLLSRTYAVTAQHLIRSSRDTLAAVAADRANRYAELAEDAVAVADAARLNAIVLRRSRWAGADQAMAEAAETLATSANVEKNREAAGMYMTIMAAAAYTAAGFDRPFETWDYFADAAALSQRVGDTDAMTTTDLAVFRVSIHRELGDFGAALHAAKHVDLNAVPTTHERARFWQEIALSARGRGHDELALKALAEIDQLAPRYLHRPWSRKIIEELLHTRAGSNSPTLRRIHSRLLVRG